MAKRLATGAAEFIGFHVAQKFLARGNTVKAENLLRVQPSDVPTAYINADNLVADVGFKPNTSTKEGLERFVAWYRHYDQRESVLG